jgi:hypothetical protein
MNCLHCQKELPANYAAEWCPFCGRDFPPSETDSVQHQLPPVKTNWLVFFFVLLAPVLLTVLAVLFGAKNGNAAPAITFFSGGAAGIVCGVMLGRQLGKTRPTRVILCVLFAFIMTVVCIGMSSFGCMASGFQLNLH